MPISIFTSLPICFLASSVIRPFFKNPILTVSIGFLKKGLITEEAKKHIGRLVNMDIGIVVEEKK